MKPSFYFLLGFILILPTISIINVTPTWQASNYLQASSSKIVNYVKTGNSQTPTGTITFPGTAFSVQPNLGYGVSGYEGKNL